MALPGTRIETSRFAVRRGVFLYTPPRHVQLKITTDCNLSCPFCYMQLDKRYADPSFLFRVFTHPEVAEHVRSVLLHGGEPTLYPFDELVPLLELLRSRGVIITITTNGTNPGWLERAAPYLQNVSVSVDPPFSQRWRGGLSYGDALKLLRDVVRRLGPNKVSVLAIITRDWLEHPDEVERFYRDVEAAGTRHVGTERVVTDDPDVAITNEQLLRLSAEMSRRGLLHLLGIKVIRPFNVRNHWDTLTRHGTATPKNTAPLNMCGWGCGCCYASLCIDPEGYCYVCAKKPYVPVYAKFSFAHDESFLAFTAQLKKAFAEKTGVPGCKYGSTCPYYQICWGGCPWHRSYPEDRVCPMGRVVA